MTPADFSGRRGFVAIRLIIDRVDFSNADLSVDKERAP
jgi:hypothetical protein